MKRVSIRKQLVALFVPGLFSLWVLSAAVCFWLVSSISAELFDKDLINSADSVVGRLRLREGKIVVDLPAAAQAILRHDEADRLYYRVIGEDGEYISGDSDLPPPSQNLATDQAKIVTAVIAGKKVQMAEVKASVPDTARKVFVQFAETTNVRRAFQEKMLLSIAIPQLLVTGLGAFAVWYGITKILTPLGVLQNELAGRSQSDLSALPDAETPEEVYPLVRTLNQMLGRLATEINAHQRFIANAAHQLRTPLAGLKTYSSIGGEISDLSELQHVVRELDVGIDRASRIVNQLLALARVDNRGQEHQPSMRLIDLNFLVSDVVAELVAQSVRQGIELNYSCSAQSATVYGDATGLKHLLTNLVENSLVYSGSGGKVLVTVRVKDDVSLTVIDSGPGIPESEREKVFERFYRVSGTAHSGSGLGLAIVKEVASAHNAVVSIDSGIAGVGTAVKISFPKS